MGHLAIMDIPEQKESPAQLDPLVGANDILLIFQDEFYRTRMLFIFSNVIAIQLLPLHFMHLTDSFILSNFLKFSVL